MPLPSLFSRAALFALVFFVVLLPACKEEEDTPEPTPGSANTCFQTLVLDEDLSVCEPSPNDYQPRSGNTHWPACISDGAPGQYQAINPNDVSTMTRVAAFGEMAGLLWNNPNAPSKEDFINARAVYSRDEGLDSRLQRREDVHFAVLPDCKRCNQVDSAVMQQHADRCTGPVKLARIVNEAFEKGIRGENPRAQAQKIEATLLWFFYLSSLSEVQTCANESKNCDSAWAYYTGGTARHAPAGLAAYVKGTQLHEQAYDAALAVRCWRDLDLAPFASNIELQYRALKQYDKALIRVLTHVLRQKVVEWEGSLGSLDAENSLSRQAFVQTLFGLMETGVIQKSSPRLQELKGLIESPSPNAATVGKMNELMDEVFPCAD